MTKGYQFLIGMVFLFVIGMAYCKDKLSLEFGATLLAFITIFLGWVALEQYKITVDQNRRAIDDKNKEIEDRKSEHLFKLFESFFTDPKFDHGTDLIEYGRSTFEMPYPHDVEFEDVVVELENEGEEFSEGQEAIIIHLNFLLYVGFASNKGNLSMDDVANLFGYYFSQLSVEFLEGRIANLQNHDPHEQLNHVQLQKRLADVLITKSHLGFNKLSDYATQISKIKFPIHPANAI